MEKFYKKIHPFFDKLKEKIKSKLGINPLSNIKIGSKEKISFLEALSNLINSGIPILNSLKIINYQTKSKKTKKLIEKLQENINKWISLKDSFKSYPKIFSQFDISIVDMWEMTGKLWESIELIKNKEEKTRELKGKILWALIYPMVIVALATAMIMVFMIYVIPKIQDMYKDAKVNLPDLTQTIINISIFLQNNLTLVIASIILFLILVITFKNHKATKIYFDRYVLYVPIFWPLIKKKILALFTSSLWTLLDRWIIINKSLEVSSGALENAYYEREIRKIISWVSKWKDLSFMMWIEDIANNKENFLFPIELSSVVKIWEQTWKLSHLLLKISAKYNKEIDNIVKNLATAIEPLVIVWVWLIIWTLIMAIMLPFFNMVNVI